MRKRDNEEEEKGKVVETACQHAQKYQKIKNWKNIETSNSPNLCFT